MNLDKHKANKASIKYAKSNSLSIEELKEKEPLNYKMLNSEPILELDGKLEQEVAAIADTVFRDHELFKLESENGLIKLLVFPSLSSEELAGFLSGLEMLLNNENYRKKNIYYRVISDNNGEHRQLAFPIEPTSWDNQLNRLVGPFDNSAAADAWIKMVADDNVNLGNDIIQYNNRYFVDLFSNSF